MSQPRPRYALEETIWVCAVCGRSGKDRYNLGDSSCATWAVLCREGGPPWTATGDNAVVAKGVIDA